MVRGCGSQGGFTGWLQKCGSECVVQGLRFRGCGSEDVVQGEDGESENIDAALKVLCKYE